MRQETKQFPPQTQTQTQHLNLRKLSYPRSFFLPTGHQSASGVPFHISIALSLSLAYLSVLLPDNITLSRGSSNHHHPHHHHHHHRHRKKNAQKTKPAVYKEATRHVFCCSADYSTENAKRAKKLHGKEGRNWRRVWRRMLNVV